MKNKLVKRNYNKREYSDLKKFVKITQLCHKMKFMEESVRNKFTNCGQ